MPWQRMFPWLAVYWVGAVATLTCTTCAKSKVRMPRWQTCAAAQVCHFQEHEETLKHKTAVGGVAPLGAPSVADFATVLRSFLNGQAPGQGIDGVGKRQKIRYMIFCLAEAVRHRTRLWLQNASSLTVHSDASQGRLLVRGQMCGHDLEPHFCLLGTDMVTEDSSALGLAGVMLRILRDLCTPLSNGPGNAQSDNLDTAALAHVCSIVEVFNADAASDEQLAGTLFAAGGLAPGGLDANASAPVGVFPNLKMVSKDKPHGARRITSRTWKCDPYLGQLAGDVVMGKSSICQILQHSDVVRARYARHVRELQINPTWRAKAGSWCAAKHRFDTWQKPFSRLVLTLEAVVATAQEMHEERRNEAVGRNAKAFLNLLNEEMIISLAMMSDAGEENLELVRFLDNETLPTTEIAAECKRFLERITVLFEGRGVVNVGHTEFALDFLRRERLVFIDHKPKRIGGTDVQPVLNRCFKRFSAWVKLAREVLAAEFPQFEIVQAFSAFHLTSERRSNPQRDRQVLVDKLTKLANLFGVSAATLLDEFDDLVPSAQFNLDAAAASDSLGAWRNVILAKDKRGRRILKHHPADTLREIVVRAYSWGCSTSGVEQLFARVRNRLTRHRNCMDPSYERDEIFLMTLAGESQAALDELSQAAQIVWSKVYGQARASHTESRRRVRDETRGPMAGSVAAFRQKRRAAVDALVKNAQHGGGAPAEGNDDAWTEAHEAEQLFQRKKRFKRALETQIAGGLLPAEQAEIFGSAEAATLASVASSALGRKKLVAYLRSQALKHLKRKPAPTFKDLVAERRVHIDRPVVVAAGAAVLDGVLAELNATAEPMREHAHCFLMADVSSPGQRTLLNAALIGGSLVSLTCFATGSGPFVTYERALAVRRRVYFSAAFKATHAVLYHIMMVRAEDRSGLPVRWNVIAERDDFVAIARRTRAGDKASVVAFLTQDETNEPEYEQATRLTANTMTSFLAKVNKAKTSMGVCRK